MALIGAWWKDLEAPWAPSCGSAYIFERQEGVWTQVQKLLPDVPALNLRFGADVALAPQGDLLAIGALGHYDDAVPRCYLLRDSAGFVAEKYVYPSHEASTSTLFGGAVDVNADHMLVGASKYASYESLSQANCGAVFSASTQAPADCDGDGQPDWCQIEADASTPPSIDCNQNEILDACEIDAGAADCDGNGDPDAQCQAPIDYELQDESGPLSTYAYGSGEAKDLLWMNHFNVVPGKETITQIGIQWAYCPVNYPARLMVYGDPNNDGNPDDAVLLSVTEVLSGPWNSHDAEKRVRWRHAITPTDVGEPGESFFVAAAMTTSAMPFSFPALATYSNIGQAWMLTAPPGAGNLKDLTTYEVFTAMNNVRFALVAFAHDCNGNDVWDQCDIENGLSSDANANGIPDECESTCAADIAPPSGNAIVDVDDLLTVINAWGVCKKGDACEADIAPAGPPQGDGIVNIDDLLFIINNWGPCI